MQTITRIADMRALVREWRFAREGIAFVPTMGNLHAGHASLIGAAHLHGRRVVASVFVNPLQFGPNEDYAAYPRTPDDDAALLEAQGVDVLFLPTVDEMYPQGVAGSTIVDVPELSGILCGAVRPGHFQGVATVVVKLLNLVQPDVGIFGEKDYQQLTIIRRSIEDLCLPVRIVGAPTVRADDGGSSPATPTSKASNARVSPRWSRRVSGPITSKYAWPARSPSPTARTSTSSC
jgi:pantoate--beta-alanine ligase